MATFHSNDGVLTRQVVVPDALPDEVGDEVWIEVIQQMDAIYVDLVQHQVALEQKNLALEETYRELQQAHEDLQNAQQQLIQSEKMASLGRLVAGVAHELNNPISFILGNAHALKRYSQRLQAFFAGLEKIKAPGIADLYQQTRIDKVLADLDPLVSGTTEGAERVSDIVDALLRFTKPQHQQAAACDASSLVYTAVQWVMRASSIKPEVRLDVPESVVVHTFEGLVHQILVNLVQNAFDAVEKIAKPVLSVSLHRGSHAITISVRDNGMGIEVDHLSKIFDPFFTTKHPGKGTGLGLYISYLLATEQCGGALEVRNHPDGGAEFCLTLPDMELQTDA